MKVALIFGSFLQVVAIILALLFKLGGAKTNVGFCAIAFALATIGTGNDKNGGISCFGAVVMLGCINAASPLNTTLNERQDQPPAHGGYSDTSILSQQMKPSTT